MAKVLKAGAVNEAPKFEGFLDPDVISPAQITATQNDYNPTGFSAAGILRLSTDASRTITGFSASGLSTSKQVIIMNVGSFDLVLANLDAGSSAANQIITGTGAALTVAAGTSITIYYDVTSTKWRVVGGAGGAAAGGGAGEKVFNSITFS